LGSAKNEKIIQKKVYIIHAVLFLSQCWEKERVVEC